ncbi:MAG: PD-(D/E)XK nuclease family protein, partial [Deltaproteobacteria bacterium]|nr:PD-(D/E)XK nuclease family protein [Deltaproteobacteria bacterium]
GFLNAQEVIDLLFCLKLLVEPEDRLSLVGLMRSPLLGFSDIEITELCLKHPTHLGKALLQRPEAAWLKNIFEKKEMMSSADILENVVQETHYDILAHELDPSGTKRANIEQLIELVRELEQDEELPLQDLVEYFEELKKRRSTLSPSSGIDLSLSEQSEREGEAPTALPLEGALPAHIIDACQLMTVHSAKGLQFPVLILPDLIRTPPPNNHPFLFVRNKGLGFSLKEEENTYLDTLKKEEKEADLEERKRLLYVALTRAEEKIVIPWHEEANRTGPWYAWLKEGISKKEFIETWSASAKRENFLQPLQNKLRGNYFTLKKFKHEEIRRPLPYFTVTELEKSVMKKTWEKVHEITSQNESTRLVGPTLGNVVHAVLKNIRDKKEILPQTLLPKILFEQGIIATEKEISTTLAMIESFLKSEIAPPRFDGRHELPFSLKLPKATIVGTIDYALETDQGWIIYDFKTDAQMDHEKYKLQMDVYALALSKGITKPVLRTELLYIRHNKKVSVACTLERLQQTQEKLIEFVEDMVKT